MSNWTDTTKPIQEVLDYLKTKTSHLSSWEAVFLEDNPTSDLTDKQEAVLRKLYLKVKDKERCARAVSIPVFKHCWLCDSSGRVYLVNRHTKEPRYFNCRCNHSKPKGSSKQVPAEFFVLAGEEDILTTHIINNEKYVIENSREHFGLLDLDYDSCLPGGDMHAEFVKSGFTPSTMPK